MRTVSLLQSADDVRLSSMDAKRALVIAVILEFVALLLVSGSRRLLDRAFLVPWDSPEVKLALQSSVVIAIAVMVLASLALAFLVRVFRRGASREKAVAAVVFVVGLLQIVAGLFVLWGGMA